MTLKQLDQLFKTEGKAMKVKVASPEKAQPRKNAFIKEDKRVAGKVSINLELKVNKENKIVSVDYEINKKKKSIPVSNGDIIFAWSEMEQDIEASVTSKKKAKR